MVVVVGRVEGRDEVREVVGGWRVSVGVGCGVCVWGGGMGEVRWGRRR